MIVVMKKGAAGREIDAVIARIQPRTSPYAFQGLGEEGLRLLARARELTGLLVVTEAMSPEAGADGLIVEVHPRLDRALSDGPQSLDPSQFADLMGRVRAVARAVGRSA